MAVSLESNILIQRCEALQSKIEVVCADKPTVDRTLTIFKEAVQFLRENSQKTALLTDLEKHIASIEKASNAFEINGAVSKIKEWVFLAKQGNLWRSYVFVHRDPIGGTHSQQCVERARFPKSGDDPEVYYEPVKFTTDAAQPPPGMFAGYPSQASTTAQYFKGLAAFQGSMDEFSEDEINDMLSSPALSLPGPIEVENGIFLRHTFVGDISRLSSLEIKGEILYDKQTKSQQQITDVERAKWVFSKVQAVLDGNIMAAQNLSKLLTQASTANAATMIWGKFVSETLGMQVRSVQLDCNITTTSDGKIVLAMTTIYQTKCVSEIESPVNPQYIAVKREFTLIKEELIENKGNGGGIIDIYSPFFDTIEAANKFVDQPPPSIRPSGYCSIM